jgi:hypothetical protein
MPLTDDNIDTHDEQLTGTFWDTFNVQDSGEITDVYGNSWVIFHEEDFNKFIYYYESLISSPIGRILHNSAADCLELMMSPLRETRTKFFAKKRLHKSIKEVWELCGWGVNDFHNTTINTNLFASVAAGFYLSSIELLENRRFKIEWSQKSNQVINFKRLDTKQEMPLPNLLNSIPWAYSKEITTTKKRSEVKLESNELGWSIEGRTSFLMPCDFFNRIIFNCSGFVEQFPGQISEKWNLVDFDEIYSNGFIALLEASKKVFLSNDNFVYLMDEADWGPTIVRHMTNFGYVAPKLTKQDKYSTVFEFNLCPSLPISIGKLVGVWERANGKSAKCSITLDNLIVKVEIFPLLEYVFEDAN